MTSSQSSDKVTIDFNEKNGRFLISSPFWMNGVARGLPNRRWDAKQRVWTAPAIRANLEYMTRMYPPGGAITYTEVAQQRMRRGVIRPVARPGVFPPHYAFRMKPWGCQHDALRHIYGMQAAALFMDMRTGKSRVVVDEFSALRVEGKVDRLLLLPPLSVRRSWEREFAKVATVPYDLHLLSTKDGGKSFERWNSQPHDFKVMIAGIESLSAGRAMTYCRQFLGASTKAACVVDESHNIKNHAATRSESAVSLGRMAEYRRILTGTPLSKHPMDLYMQFEFLDPNIIGLGDFYSFRNRYAVMGGYEDREIVGYDNLDELFEILSPFVYQVRQADVPELKLLPKVHVVREVELSPAQRKLYATMADKKALMDANGAIQVQNTLELLLRLQEITGGFVSYATPNATPTDDKFYRMPIPGPNPKINELLAVTEEYVGPTLVWCAYIPEIKLAAAALRKEYGDEQVLEIHGGVDEDTRDEYVQRFQSGRARFIVGNAATGGVGLTMSTATVNIYLSNTHNFIHRSQSSERSTGIEKPAPVTEIDIIAIGTCDEVIVESLRHKLDVSEYVRAAIKKGRAQALLTGEAARGIIDSDTRG